MCNLCNCYSSLGDQWGQAYDCRAVAPLLPLEAAMITGHSSERRLDVRTTKIARHILRATARTKSTVLWSEITEDEAPTGLANVRESRHAVMCP